MTGEAQDWPVLFEPDPFPKIFRTERDGSFCPSRDWEGVARALHALAGIPGHVSIGELVFQIERWFPRYCAGCSVDHVIASQKTDRAHLKRGYSRPKLRGQWFMDNEPLYGRPLPKPFPVLRCEERARLSGLITNVLEKEGPEKFEEFKRELQRHYELGHVHTEVAKLCAELGALHIMDGRDPYAMREAARQEYHSAFETMLLEAMAAGDIPNRRPNDPKKRAARVWGHKKETTGPHKQWGNHEAISGAIKILLLLMGNKEFGARCNNWPEIKNRLETGKRAKGPLERATELLLKAADPGLFDPNVPCLAFYRRLPGDKMYRTIFKEITRQ